MAPGLWLLPLPQTSRRPRSEPQRGRKDSKCPKALRASFQGRRGMQMVGRISASREEAGDTDKHRYSRFTDGKSRQHKMARIPEKPPRSFGWQVVAIRVRPGPRPPRQGAASLAASPAHGSNSPDCALGRNNVACPRGERMHWCSVCFYFMLVINLKIASRKHISKAQCPQNFFFLMFSVWWDVGMN